MKVIEVTYTENGEEKTKLVKRRWDHALDADEIKAYVSQVQEGNDHGVAGYEISDKGDLRLTFANNEEHSRKLIEGQ